MEQHNDTQKKFLSMPMRWEFKNALKDIWNPEENRLFPPKHFGVGWGLNFHVLAKKLKLVDSKVEAPKTEQ